MTENFGRLLALNSGQPIEAFYIAGGDHYRRTTDQGEPDTLEKLEKVSKTQRVAGNHLHTISAVFVERKDASKVPRAETFLSVHVLPPIPFSFSSTMTRRALCQNAFCTELMSLPYSCFVEIKMGGFYKAQCVERGPS